MDSLETVHEPACSHSVAHIGRCAVAYDGIFFPNLHTAARGRIFCCPSVLDEICIFGLQSRFAGQRQLTALLSLWEAKLISTKWQVFSAMSDWVLHNVPASMIFCLLSRFPKRHFQLQICSIAFMVATFAQEHSTSTCANRIYQTESRYLFVIQNHYIKFFSLHSMYN